MVNKTNEPKQDASMFFTKNIYQSAKDTSIETSMFKEALRSQVLDQYNTIYYSNDKMANSTPFWKRWQVLGSGLFAFVIAISLSIFLLNKPTEQADNDDTNQGLGAEVAFFDGDLEVQTGADMWADANVDTQISEGTTLRVAGDGRAVINLDDGSAIRIAKDSAVTFASLDPQNIVITNEYGEIYTRVVKADRSFVVETADATYSSLGTAYKTINKDGEKGVYVYQSEVEVKHSDKDVKVAEGKKYLLKTTTSEKTNEVVDIKDSELKDDFTKWNKEQDQKEFANELGVLAKDLTAEQPKPEEQKPVETTPEPPKTETPAPTPTPAPTASLVITSAQGKEGGFKVFWEVANMDVSNGFKVVYNKTGNPAYGVDSASYQGKDARYAAITGVPAGTYYVKVCRYTGSGCDYYSQQATVTVTAPAAYTPLSSITLTPATGGAVYWTVAYPAQGGYKLVWSTTPGPVYPGSNASYYESHKTSGDITWSGATPGATYYVRICEYVNNLGGCGVYSNEITITL